MDTVACRYLIYGKEIAPETGTPHLQGYISFRAAKTLSAARRILPGCHLTVARGSGAQNKEYCSKGGDVYERGDLPLDPAAGGLAEKARWVDTWNAARNGDLESIPADIRVRYYTTLKKIGADYMPKVGDLESTCGLWIYGESGSGKTRTVRAAYPDAYLKPRTKWWDGYQGEDVVLCDDVDKFNVALGGSFKDWADFCPFIGEIKGTSVQIRPKKFIVTSQYRIEDIWQDEETRVALNRRFVFVEKILGQNIII